MPKANPNTVSLVEIGFKNGSPTFSSTPFKISTGDTHSLTLENGVTLYLPIVSQITKSNEFNFGYRFYCFTKDIDIVIASNLDEIIRLNTVALKKAEWNHKKARELKSYVSTQTVSQCTKPSLKLTLDQYKKLCHFVLTIMFDLDYVKQTYQGYLKIESDVIQKYFGFMYPNDTPSQDEVNLIYELSAFKVAVDAAKWEDEHKNQGSTRITWRNLEGKMTEWQVFVYEGKVVPNLNYLTII